MDLVNVLLGSALILCLQYINKSMVGQKRIAEKVPFLRDIFIFSI